MKASTVAPTDMPVPVGVPQTFDEHIKLQFDLMALAFQADITRVGTLLFARDLTGRTYPESEAPTSGFHGVSHHGEDPKNIALLSKINQYHVKMLAHLIGNLAKTQDGDGTLLDHSLVLYGSNMGNSNQHVHYDVPHVLVGGLNGKLKGGRHMAYPTKTDTDRQPAVERAGHVRHSPGQHRRQHGPSWKICREESMKRDIVERSRHCCLLLAASPALPPDPPRSRTRSCAAITRPCGNWWPSTPT